ncbi:MAG: undecaprenyl/decaprenyl-phosphate alpha-N-acetylglucosaminyl 1-phosphate transferase, partial [Clostridiales bacterium]|nr:undecaprenyl/decaprenyl-phosphate alpha-N-acetylglucosaminyl 1-phosphate transferase [Clostridiales bacterium]
MIPQTSNFFILSLFAFFIAGLISFFSTPVVKIFAHRIGAIDVPKDNRRMHKLPIPRLGGLAIFFGFIFSVLLFGQIDAPAKGILLGSVIIVVLGVIDDIISLNALIKFLVQILAALIPVLAGVRIEFLSNPNIFSNSIYFGLGYLSIPITILWIVGITNAVNLIDGLDGLAVGVSSIASLSLFVVAMLVSEPFVAIVMAALAGACIGFMPYNITPAKIFMGDTGATFLGYILAVVSIQGLFKFYA